MASSSEMAFFFSGQNLEVAHTYQPQDTVLGWGYKKSGLRALDLAEKKQLKGAILIEDGFLRSMGLGVNGDAPLSIVVDDLGIYYDAAKPSRLETLILAQEDLLPRLPEGERALRLVIEHQLTKYNHLPATWPAHLSFDAGKKQVLVIDQTFGDLSLQYGGVTPETFQEMLSAAKAENPDAVIWVKIHPDVLAGKKQGILRR